MKKIIKLSAVLSFLAFNSFGQNTYPWPSSGSIGIGTASPGAKLHINDNTDPRLLIQRSDKRLFFYWDATNSAWQMDTYNTDGTRSNLSLNPVGGNVGIGTASPGAKLHINDNTDPRLLIQRSDKRLFFYWDATNSAWQMDTYNTDGTRSNLSLNPVGGNVGIGTASPGAKLHINDNTDPRLLIQRSDKRLFFYWDATNSAWQMDTYNTDGTRSNLSLNPVGGNVGIGTLTPRSKLEVNGAVIIGTTKPANLTAGTDYMLAVSGKVYCQEVNVTPSTAWSDYVFKNDYKLATLEEVEAHIKEKGHLKDVPSAEEVGKNGIKLGEMDATLLRKIEELTLYTIELNKSLSELKKENQAIKQTLQTINK